LKVAAGLAVNGGGALHYRCLFENASAAIRIRNKKMCQLLKDWSFATHYDWNFDTHNAINSLSSLPQQERVVFWNLEERKFDWNKYINGMAESIVIYYKKRLYY